MMISPQQRATSFVPSFLQYRSHQPTLGFGMAPYPQRWELINQQLQQCRDEFGKPLDLKIPSQYKHYGNGRFQENVGVLLSSTPEVHLPLISSKAGMLLEELTDVIYFSVALAANQERLFSHPLPQKFIGDMVQLLNKHQITYDGVKEHAIRLTQSPELKGEIQRFLSYFPTQTFQDEEALRAMLTMAFQDTPIKNSRNLKSLDINDHEVVQHKLKEEALEIAELLPPTPGEKSTFDRLPASFQQLIENPFATNAKAQARGLKDVIQTVKQLLREQPSIIALCESKGMNPAYYDLSLSELCRVQLEKGGDRARDIYSFPLTLAPDEAKALFDQKKKTLYKPVERTGYAKILSQSILPNSTKASPFNAPLEP
ncbi:MAG: hypothetical protein K2X66_17285 [Cyanobacteria bacterium]|nr:hypothetical protein [Cyanobacteriota bacterium]